MAGRLSAAFIGLALAVCLTAAPARAGKVPLALGIGAAALAAINFAFDMPEPDAETEFLSLGAGAFDPIDRDNQAVEFKLEYWAPWTWLRMRPIVGIFATTDKGIGGYLAVRHDLFLSDNIVLSVETGPALYAANEGLHLGSYAVLRSGFGLAYRFDNASRISLTLHHMSHGEVFDDRNPGVESAMISYTVPIRSLFGK